MLSKIFSTCLLIKSIALSATAAQQTLYYPAFSSDEAGGKIPHSLQTGPRFSEEQMEKLKTMALDAAPGRKILQNLKHDHAAIIPLQGLQGRYLHLKLLDNNSEKADTKGRSHISGIYFATADGKILPHKNYSFADEGNLHPHFGQDPASMMLNGNNSRFWRPADGRSFPYHFTVDCKQSQKADYLIIARAAPTGWLPFFKNFELELSDNKAPDASKTIKLNANHFVTSKSAEEKLQGKPLVTISDASGTISLRHYNATQLNGNMTWTLWAPKGQKYQAFLRLKDPGQSLTGNFTFGRNKGKITNSKISIPLEIKQSKGYTFSVNAADKALANVLAIDLVPKNQREFYLAQNEAPKVSITEPDLDAIHPSIVQKMEEVAAGHYDIRTTIPTQIKKGKNGYVIITTEEKRQALTSLDAFIRQKESKGFDVSVITEKDFGGGKGQEAAINIRAWLQKHYKKDNILYVLFLGNPHPELGDTPYKFVGERLWPTDYYFVDLTGNWDLDGNGIYADEGDYGEGGINGEVDVYVGRIPFYGIDAAVGNAQQVDAILERTIRYENQAGDLAWRHNIYYAGDTFERTQNFFYEYLSHNGAKLTRHSHSPNLIYAPDIDHYRQHETIKAQNEGTYGFVYYQEHGSPWGIGMMSTGGTEELSDRNPSVYALGGCDVASPEHPNNVSFALLRNNGVAVYAGTRSVASCKQHRWTKHTKYYPRLYFGMSTGETLWSTRADQTRGTTIGGTNFLINLLGDPSVVPMPQTTGQQLSVSPGFDIRVAAVQGETTFPSITYEVQNNGPIPEKYEVRHVRGLKVSAKNFSLRPGKFKQFKVSITDPSKLRTGETELMLQVASSTEKRRLSVIADIKERKQVYYNNFDSPITFIDNDRKKVDLTAEESLSSGAFKSAAKVKDYKAQLQTEKWGDRTSYTVSYFQNIETPGNYDIIRTGPISIMVNGGKVKVWKRPAGWVYGEKPAPKTYDGPKYTPGKWQQISVIYNSPSQKLTIIVDDKKEEHSLNYSEQISFSSSKLELSARGNSSYAIDELSIYNYSLNQTELNLIAKQQFITPTLPLENSKVNPSNVILSWENESSKPAKLEVATDPSFRRILMKKIATKGAKIGKLKDKTRYYWRVNHPASNRSFTTSNIVRSFVTDKTIKPVEFEVKEINLPIAKVGVSGYNKRLNGFLTGLDREQAKQITFTKLAGPEWLRIYPDGLLFTNYGPTTDDKGLNKFRVKITASDGTTEIADFEIKVE